VLGHLRYTFGYERPKYKKEHFIIEDTISAERTFVYIVNKLYDHYCGEYDEVLDNIICYYNRFTHNICERSVSNMKMNTLEMMNENRLEMQRERRRKDKEYEQERLRKEKEDAEWYAECKEQKRIKRIENAQRKLQEFENWKEGYLQTFDYTDFSNSERRDLLDEYLLQHDMERREDSQLCQSFIHGGVRDKSIEHIAAILKLTEILFSYSHIVYSYFHETCKITLEVKKCENDLKNFKKLNKINKNSNRLKNKVNKRSNLNTSINLIPTYTWFNAVDDVHDKYRRDFERYEHNYYQNGFAGHHWYEDDEDEDEGFENW